MTMRSGSLVLGGVLLAMTLGADAQRRPPTVPSTSGDTPIVITGGSVMPRITDNKSEWVHTRRHYEYSAAVLKPGKVRLVLQNFDSKASRSAIDTGGWVITYATHAPGVRQDVKNGAILVCSDPACGGKAHDHPVLDGTGNVYVVAANGTRWTEHKPAGRLSELHAHDTEDACDGNDENDDVRHNTSCTKIHHIEVLTEKNPGGINGEHVCTDADKKCHVLLGNGVGTGAPRAAARR